MNRFSFVIAAVLVSSPAIAQHPAATPPAQKADPSAPSPKLQHLLESCDAHKFETNVRTMVDGKPHDSKVKLCGTEGQSDSDWIGTLNDAIAKLDSNKEMDPAVRDQIVVAVKAEIVRLEDSPSNASSAQASLQPRAPAATQPLSNDYSVLPPLPAPVSSPQMPAASASNLQAGVAARAPMIVPPPVPVAKPRLSFSCISPDYPGGGECVSLSRDTILSVTAGEQVAGGVSLQFLRGGEERGDIALGAMRKGQSLRFDLPPQVCTGVVTTEIRMNVVRSGQVVDSQGPFLLHC